MIRPKFSKTQITDKILEQLKEQNIPLPAYKGNLEIEWWFGRGNGLRLTTEGKRIFELLGIEYYEYPLLTSKSKSKAAYSYYGLLVELSRKIMCPYHIHLVSTVVTLRIYDSEIAMLISLYGSVEEYLNSFDNR